MADALYPGVLLASADGELVKRLAGALAAQAGCMEVLTAARALLQASAEQPQALIMLDTRLPGMECGQLLAALQAQPGSPRLQIVLFSDGVTDEWRSRLREGVIADVMPLEISAEFLTLRIEMALAARNRERELERLRELDAMNGVTDPLTRVYSRAALLPLLLRETDRVQRMKAPLCLTLVDIDDFGHWNRRLGVEACDDLLVQTAGRLQRLLRSYDLLGRMGKDEFLAALPGCSAVNAMTLAERIRQEVFARPFKVAGKAIRLSACFAVTSSQGRSPVVVLRELEECLIAAKREGPETIRMGGRWQRAKIMPVELLSEDADALARG